VPCKTSRTKSFEGAKFRRMRKKASRYSKNSATAERFHPLRQWMAPDDGRAESNGKQQRNQRAVSSNIHCYYKWLPQGIAQSV
jgi:hypothetical protein